MLGISDTGIGIGYDQMQTILRRYTTSRDINDKRTGTGLGLYIVSAIVKAHGGRIIVSSEPGDGSTFMVYLPIKGEEESEE